MDPRGDRRGPATSHPASVLRSDIAGVCRRRAQRVCAVRYSCHRWMVAGRAGSSRDRSRRGRCRDLVWTVPAGERALRVVAGRSLQPSQSDCRAERRCRRRGTPHDSRASCGGDGANRLRRTVSRDERRDARPGADGRVWLSNRWTGGRASAGASRTGAGGRLLNPEGSRQSPTDQRRSLRRSGRRHADRLRLPDFSGGQHQRREVCHGTGHARRRKLPRDDRRAAASRSNDHGRRSRHGGAGRGDFRTARQATVSRHGADWRTGDDHAGRGPRAGVHDCGRECGLRHVTTDHRAAADPAAAARLVRRPGALAKGETPSRRRCISSRAARRATNRS